MTVTESVLTSVGKRIKLSKPRDQLEILRQFTNNAEFEIEITGRIKGQSQELTLSIENVS